MSRIVTEAMKRTTRRLYQFAAVHSIGIGKIKMFAADNGFNPTLHLNTEERLLELERMFTEQFQTPTKNGKPRKPRPRK